ncbi:MAG: hypothetical protein ACTSX6_04695 [Candidatus Heimdallarchaeaceae archaeon]
MTEYIQRINIVVRSKDLLKLNEIVNSFYNLKTREYPEVNVTRIKERTEEIVAEATTENESK